MQAGHEPYRYVHLHLQKGAHTTVLRLEDRFRVRPGPSLYADLKALLGAGCLMPPVQPLDADISPEALAQDEAIESDQVESNQEEGENQWVPSLALIGGIAAHLKHTRPGVEIVGPMHVFGEDDAPHGHMHIRFNDVRVPAENMLPGVKGLKGPLSCLTQARYGITWGSIGAAQACLAQSVIHELGDGLRDRGVVSINPFPRESPKTLDDARRELGQAAGVVFAIEDGLPAGFVVQFMALPDFDHRGA